MSDEERKHFERVYAMKAMIVILIITLVILLLSGCNQAPVVALSTAGNVSLNTLDINVEFTAQDDRTSVLDWYLYADLDLLDYGVIQNATLMTVPTTLPYRPSILLKVIVFDESNLSAESTSHIYIMDLLAPSVDILSITPSNLTMTAVQTNVWNGTIWVEGCGCFTDTWHFVGEFNASNVWAWDGHASCVNNDLSYRVMSVLDNPSWIGIEWENCQGEWQEVRIV